MKNRNAFQGIFTMRCPKCRQGKMFPEGTLYTNRFMEINKQCSCCEQSFTPEPGHYLGTMFVGYGINITLFIIVWLGMYLFMKEVPMSAVIAALLIVVVGLLPLTFRLSRVLWIYIFVKYESEECW